MKNNIYLKSFNYKRPLLFLLSLSIVGYGVPVLGQVFVIGLLSESFYNKKYDFLIQLVILMGGWSFFGLEQFIPGIKLYDVFIPILVTMFVCINNTKEILRIKEIIFLFLFGIFVLILSSDESVLSQLNGYRHFFGILTFTLPLLLFKNRRFSIEYLLKRLTAYSIIIAVMVIVQAFIKTPVFFHNLTGFTSGGIISSSFFARIYPPPLIIITLSLFYRKFVNYTPNIKILFFVAYLVTVTNTLWIAVLTILLMHKLSLKNPTKLAKIFFIITAFFFIDKATPEIDFRFYSSYVRINNAIVTKQYENLGTGRMAQALPSIDYIIKNKKQLTGIGLLTKEKGGDKYMIEKEYDSATQEEFIGAIEITPISIWINLGFIGLGWIILFHGLLLFRLSKYKLFDWVKEIVIFFIIMGIGGFYGLQYIESYLVIGFVVGFVLLDHINVKRKYFYHHLQYNT